MVALLELHDNIMFYLVIILFLLALILISISNYVYNKFPIINKYLNHGTLIGAGIGLIVGIGIVFACLILSVAINISLKGHFILDVFRRFCTKVYIFLYLVIHGVPKPHKCSKSPKLACAGCAKFTYTGVILYSIPALIIGLYFIIIGMAIRDLSLVYDVIHFKYIIQQSIEI